MLAGNGAPRLLQVQARRRDGLLAASALILLGIIILILSDAGTALAVGAGFIAGGLAGIVAISLLSRFTGREDRHWQGINEQMTQIAQWEITDVNSSRAWTPARPLSALDLEHGIQHWRRNARLMEEHLATHRHRLNDSTVAALEQARDLAEDRADELSDEYRRRFRREP
jgi:hypothetical protein